MFNVKSNKMLIILMFFFVVIFNQHKLFSANDKNDVVISSSGNKNSDFILFKFFNSAGQSIEKFTGLIEIFDKNNKLIISETVNSKNSIIVKDIWSNIVNIKITSNDYKTFEINNFDIIKQVNKLEVKLEDKQKTGIAIGSVNTSNAQVQIKSLDGRIILNQNTDSTGKFSFENLPYGDYIFSVTAEGYATQTGNFSVNAEKVDLTKIELSEKKRIVNLLIIERKKKNIIVNADVVIKTEDGKDIFNGKSDFK